MRVIERNSIAYRSVDLFTKQNKIKNHQLDELYFVYKKAYAVALSYMLFAFYNTYSETPFTDIKSMANKVTLEKLFVDFLDIASKRLLALVYQQAYADFKCHVKLIRYYIIEATKKTHSLSDNKSLYHDFKNQIKDYKFTTNRVLHSIFRHVTKRLARKPSLKLKNMMLDCHVVKIEEAKNSTSFDRWIRVAPLKGKEAIYIPYKNSSYKEHNTLNAYQFIRIDNSFSIRRFQTVDRVEYSPLAKIDPAYTSKTCHKCNHINYNLTVNDRIFNCPDCGLVMDRDEQSSINIHNIGMKSLGLGISLQTINVKPFKIVKLSSLQLGSSHLFR